MTIFFVIIIIIIFFILRTFGFSESSGGYSATSEAFIFSLNNNEGLAPIVSKVKIRYSGKAIYRWSYYPGHVLAWMSSLEIMPTVTTSQQHVWAIATLLQLQCRTGTQSWPGLSTSHLMRWRYSILTHPAKFKITQTIIFIAIKSEREAMESLI